MENIEKAKKIRNEIVKQIGFNNQGLVRWAKGDPDIGTFPNAAFAILEATIGEEKVARDIRDKIVTHIGYCGGMIDTMINPPQIIENSRKIYTVGPMPAHNAVFGLLELALGEKGNAELIKENMKRNFPFDSNGLIGRRISTYDDMLYSRKMEVDYSKPSTNLFRLLCHGLDDDQGPTIPIKPGDYGFREYLEYGLSEGIMGNNLKENEILGEIASRRKGMSNGLIVEKDGLYPYGDRISTIANSFLGLFYVSDRFKEKFPS